MNGAVLGANCWLSCGAMSHAVVPPTGLPSASVQSKAAPPHDLHIDSQMLLVPGLQCRSVLSLEENSADASDSFHVTFDA